ncbi:methylaspartate mutase [Streptomyces sp. NPDC001584]|uniref:methylaspartate mutase n=1 Tax=Streptomyces sp. NPDC001584 TaxID=3154521 RepID=UPI003325594E
MASHDAVDFGEFVQRRHTAGELVVQPRMGFGDPGRMRAGLLATKQADATTVGTLTLDSFTRVGDLDSAARALREGIGLNGYPIVSHEADTTAGVLAGVLDAGFPVQVRHGSARPQHIFRSLVGAGLSATEGGPVSYCLPYGRTPLDESVRNWSDCCELLLRVRDSGVEPHIETFGGCMLGQLCPPSELVAVSALEALFFYRHGLRSISVSYAQQTHAGQDQEAIASLRALCAELLPEARWHVVVYAYMGLYPTTPGGSLDLLAGAAELAVTGGASRLIVKTVAESHRIPTVAENVQALEHAARAARAARVLRPAPAARAGGAGPAPYANTDSQVHREARALVEAVLNCHADIGQALVIAFKRGLLDIPYCLHPDNAGRARSHIGPDGRLGWAELGALPLTGVVQHGRAPSITSSGLMQALSYVQGKFDAAALERDRRPVLGTAAQPIVKGELA